MFGKIVQLFEYFNGLTMKEKVVFGSGFICPLLIVFMLSVLSVFGCGSINQDFVKIMRKTNEQIRADMTKHILASEGNKEALAEKVKEVGEEEASKWFMKNIVEPQLGSVYAQQDAIDDNDESLVKKNKKDK